MPVSSHDLLYYFVQNNNSQLTKKYLYRPSSLIQNLQIVFKNYFKQHSCVFLRKNFFLRKQKLTKFTYYRYANYLQWPIDNMVNMGDVSRLLNSGVESAAQMSIGQAVLRVIDKILWIVEKSIQWSLPAAEKSQGKLRSIF